MGSPHFLILMAITIVYGCFNVFLIDKTSAETQAKLDTVLEELKKIRNPN